jgi:hypothetical protein
MRICELVVGMIIRAVPAIDSEIDRGWRWGADGGEDEGPRDRGSNLKRFV